MEKNKIVEALEKMDPKIFMDPTPVFPPVAYELFKKNGLSEEEINELERTELLTRILELLPTDEKGETRLAGALQAISTDSDKQNAINLVTIAQKDPQMLVQLMALTEVFDSTEQTLKYLKETLENKQK